MDVVCIKGRIGLYDGFYVMVAISGVGSGLVQGGIVGATGEVDSSCCCRREWGFSKAIYPQAVHGLRNSTNPYFIVGIVVMIICIVFYNVVDKLPIIKYHNDLKIQVVNEEKEEKGVLTGATWRRFPFPGTTGLVSNPPHYWLQCALPALYLLEAEGCCRCIICKIVVFPLFLGFLHGHELFRTAIPVTLLTCLLGLTNGYLISVSMILAPKTVQLQHKETAGTVIVLFLFAGLAFASIVAWFWDF
ncbi:Equilibrative nucleotide transporter 1 [Camellia lanceoleosa]|uniref:Equilibrative nucleotide transporter 1 n=1 Tax=Camellia lanceoleosa TaxID=1840588 RepID=A0ACC0G5S8_9ERIC|nr:Equilibrative nucleotide transporter 1 [Camellia lanceoleosa]